jgi:hypothetical protein
MAYKKLIRYNDIDPMLSGFTWSGVRWNASIGATSMTRIGDVNYDPIFQDISLVALSDAGIVNATLATYNSPTISGAVDGSNGQVMVRIPRKYYREIFDDNGNLCGFDMSNYPLSGFKLHEKFSWGNGRGEIYVGAYEGSTGAAKLQSISGVALEHTKTLAEFSALAVARGANWHSYDYYTQHLIQMLFYLYYADFNSQVVLPGYTEHSWDPSYKRNTGRTDAMTSLAGSVNADSAGVDADLVAGWLNSSRVIANRFFWIENIYGHCWKFLDGCVFDGLTGQPNTAYLTPNPTLFSSVDADVLSKYINMNVDIPAAVDMNYMQTLGGLFLPKSFGGNSSTYVTDYFWSYLDNAGQNYLRVVISGCSLNNGAQAGVAARNSYNAFGVAASNFVSRLCFEQI